MDYLLAGAESIMNPSEQEAYEQAGGLARERFWHPARQLLESKRSVISPDGQTTGLNVQSPTG